MPGPTGPRTTSQRRGDAAEAHAAARLEALGWTILGRQVRIGRKEIDLLAIDPGPPRTLVVVEVRWRRSRDYGLVEETLAGAKGRHLRAAVAGLLAAGALTDGRLLPRLPIRVDLIALEPARAGEPGRSPVGGRHAEIGPWSYPGGPAGIVVRHHRNVLWS